MVLFVFKYDDVKTDNYLNKEIAEFSYWEFSKNSHVPRKSTN